MIITDYQFYYIFVASLVFSLHCVWHVHAGWMPTKTIIKPIIGLQALMQHIPPL